MFDIEVDVGPSKLAILGRAFRPLNLGISILSLPERELAIPVVWVSLIEGFIFYFA